MNEPAARKPDPPVDEIDPFATPLPAPPPKRTSLREGKSFVSGKPEGENKLPRAVSWQDFSPHGTSIAELETVRVYAVSDKDDSEDMRMRNCCVVQ